MKKKKNTPTIFAGRSIRPAMVASKDKVLHKLFGSGIVLNVRMAANSEYYYVDTEFDEPYSYPEGNDPTRLRTLRDDYLEKIEDTTPIEEDTTSLGDAEGDVVLIGAK